MEVALFLVALALSVLVVTALAHRIDVPPPLVLVSAGIAASYVPGMPEVRLEPEVVLIGLLPPLLYAAALQTSLVDFNAHRRSIMLLSVGLVVFTTTGIAVLIHLLLPSVGWPAAFAIGAVVAPPDAVSATAIARRIGLPRRIVTILEGESLFNDATALVSLRTAIAVGAGGITALEVGRDFAVAAGGGVLVGLVGYLIVSRVRLRLADPLMDTAISLVVPFACYLAAESFGGSGVIAVVVAGLLLGHQAQIVQTAQSRISERMNWRTISFVLENAVFLLIGLQAERLFADVGRSDLGTSRIFLVCGSTLLGVIVLRLVWVSLARYLLIRPGPGPISERIPPWSYTLLLGWAGMRGVVTLAAALVIPVETEYREILLLAAFTVVAGTLLLQGLTLPWLARRLRVPAPDPREDALARATLLEQASKSGLAELERIELEDPHGVIDLIRQRLDQRNFAAWERLSTTPGEESPSDLYSRIRHAMIAAERARVLEVRSSGTMASEVVSEVLAMLDVEESMLDRSAGEWHEGENEIAPGPRGELCDDLREQPPVDTGGDGTCSECLVEGTRWVALRQCLACSSIGCCDSSPGRHATRHFEGSGHPVMQSAEPGEHWRWCFVHHRTG